MPYCNNNGASVWYEAAGSGNALVFIHGLGASGDIWQRQVEMFSPICQVVTCDMRGHGRSGPLAGKCDLGELAADVRAMLDQLGISRAVVCGVSFGGVVAQRFALDFGDRCAGLILVDTFSALGRPVHTLYDALVWVVARATIPIYLLPEPVLRPMRRLRFKKWELAQEHAVKGAGLTRRDYVRIRSALNEIDFAPELGQLSCPTLGVVGANEGHMRRFMDSVTRIIPRAHKVVVPDAIDPTPLCQPEEFNRLLMEFLSDVGWAGEPVAAGAPGLAAGPTP